MKNRLIELVANEYSIDLAQPLILVFRVDTQQRSVMCNSGNRSLDCYPAFLTKVQWYSFRKLIN